MAAVHRPAPEAGDVGAFMAVLVYFAAVVAVAGCGEAPPAPDAGALPACVDACGDNPWQCDADGCACASPFVPPIPCTCEGTP